MNRKAKIATLLIAAWVLGSWMGFMAGWNNGVYCAYVKVGLVSVSYGEWLKKYYHEH